MTPVTIVINIPDGICKDFLTSSYEGGSAYWLACENVVYTGEGRYYGVEKIVGCHDVEDESTKWGDLDLVRVAEGIQRIVSGSCKVRSDIRGQVLAFVVDPEDGQWDADTADCVVQAALFNEIVYG